VAKEVPDRIRLSDDELKELLVEAKHQLITTEGTGEASACAIVTSSSADNSNDNDDNGMQVDMEEKDNRTEAVADLDDEIDQLYMAGYDDDETEGVRMDGAGMAGLTYYATNDDDPYITLKGEADEDEDETIKINPQDNLIICGKADGDMSTLDIEVYNADEDVLFTHHSILLSAFPLAVEWLDYDPHPDNGHGNYVAVGTMDPVIEVWDLDVIDEMEPVFVLGSKMKLKSKKKVGQGHSDAVMALSWNRSVKLVSPDQVPCEVSTFTSVLIQECPSQWIS
jgi:periodic tryptophan protein 1